MVLFDASILLFVLDKKTPAPLDSTTGKPIEGAKERIEYLIQKLEEEDNTIVIPTPVLSEILVRAGKAGADYVQKIDRSARFKIAPFDTRAAVEVASMAREAIVKGRKKGDSTATWAKIKYDRQIVAIAIIENVSTIYSDDKDLRTLAQTHHIKTYGLAHLPMPPGNPQTSILDEIQKLSE
jgi:predicted nucleic acid-binding protein